MLRLPPMTALPAFEATARLGSVSAAADELGRTHSAVSKQLKNLSQDLGVKLFEKHGTGLRLTDAGHDFHLIVAKSLGEISDGWRALRSEKFTEQVVIGISSTLSQRWLMPRLSGFYSDFSRARITQNTGLRSLAVIDDEDLCGVITWDRLRTSLSELPNHTSVGDVEIHLVHAPDFDVVAEDSLIKTRQILTLDSTPKAWSRWAEQKGTKVVFETETHFPHAHLMIEAAVRGDGVALIEGRLIERELRDELLVSNSSLRIKGGFAVTITKKGETSAGMAAFVSWLKGIT